MKNSNDVVKRKYFMLSDLLVVAVVLCVVFAGIVRFFLPQETEGLVAVIKVKGEVFQKISLCEVKEPYELTVAGEEPVLLRISSDSVEFVKSDCPDKLCVNTGELRYAGQSAVCLPARVSVTLIGEDDAVGSAPDVIVG